MHGRGNLYFSHGAHYNGEMSIYQLHGKGRVEGEGRRGYGGRVRHRRKGGSGPIV